jgi:nitrite reductase (NO-forming)
VEPAVGLPKVDREFYVMQGELYTDRPFGQPGHDEFSVEKLLAERPEYYVFNGAVSALTAEHPMKAKVGETVRIFFGVGGPNATSSFHVIGEIFDRVYGPAAIGSPESTHVRRRPFPPAGPRSSSSSWRSRAATSSWIAPCHGSSGAWLVSWWSRGRPSLTCFTVMVPRA